MNLREQLSKNSRQSRASSREALIKLGLPEAAEPPCESMFYATKNITSHTPRSSQAFLIICSARQDCREMRVLILAELY